MHTSRKEIAMSVVISRISPVWLRKDRYRPDKSTKFGTGKVYGLMTHFRRGAQKSEVRWEKYSAGVRKWNTTYFTRFYAVFRCVALINIAKNLSVHNYILSPITIYLM